MKRKIIKIDEEKCTGCGLCVPNCQEEAIKIIDGKAKLVSDVFCDGLGACLGECPEGALSIEDREAKPFDEKMVMENIARKKCEQTQGHGGKATPHGLGVINPATHGCPGSAHAIFERKSPVAASAVQANTQQSELTHWPIQFHLVNPAADFFRGKDVVLAADCIAYSLPDFHERFLKGKSLAIACPKLDEGQDVYREKIRKMADEAEINTLTVIMMEVPCCRGLLQIAQTALQSAKRKVPLKAVIVGTRGDVISEEWI
ncbi:MAG: 4Fe-4S binding protein [Smithellaceae bacterium]|jgi:ferredoxin